MAEAQVCQEHKLYLSASREAAADDPYYDPDDPTDLRDCDLDDPRAVEFQVCASIPGKTYADIIYRSDKRSEAVEFYCRACAHW
jgi:hypothetical protein